MVDLMRDSESYRLIEAAYEKKREKSRRELDMRRKLAYDQIPRLNEIEDEIAAKGLAYNRALLSGESTLDQTLNAIDCEIGDLRKKRDGMLLENGYPADYLTISHECALCGDTGISTGDGGVPERCACFRRQMHKIIESQSNVAATGFASFENFDESLFSDKVDEAKYKQNVSPRANIRRLMDSAKRYTRAMRDGICENLYFFGETGTGKTYMAAAIASELIRDGVSVLYLSAPILFDIISEYRYKSYRDAEYRDAAYRHIYSCELLIIDDLGIELITDAKYLEFIDLLNERLAFAPIPEERRPTSGSKQRGMSGFAKSTIISTNLNLNELRLRYDDRIVSRIVGGFRIIYFFGDDIRQKLRGI